MRLTLKFLIKSFVVVVFFLFLLPVIMNLMDSPEQDAHRRRENIKKRNGVDDEPPSESKLKFRPFQVPPIGGVDDHNEENQLQPWDSNDGGAGAGDDTDAARKELDEKPRPAKVYGPKAVLKKGQLGNYEPTHLKDRGGPGASGEPVYTSMAEKAEADRTIREFGFNMVASDKIAMDRIIPDTRLDECQYWEYPEKLPNASVIIVFHNEGWSTLMRTVHSVINMTPKQLLHEVVMVDDYSDKPHLKEKLDEYIEQFHGLVKLYRNAERLGLIGTRTLGAKYATGEVIVFLDAHCECNRNWLAPLLARIRYDRTIMSVPIVDRIDWDNFRYSSTYGSANNHLRGIFEWGFLYKESVVPVQELRKREHNSEPYWTLVFKLAP